MARWRRRRSADAFGWRPYVSSAEGRLRAELAANRLTRAGRALSPVEIEGRDIARTFWGRAWCENLERYSDFATRLPRGRTYVRGGRVLDLQIGAGEVTALVSGSEVYEVRVAVARVPAPHWRRIRQAVAGRIDSLVELLQGQFSNAVMEPLCTQGTGLFPTPEEISFTCTCPDWAAMCKHVAATLYGIGARLDREPALLFRLRQVDERELLARAGEAPLAATAPPSDRILTEGDLAELFGLQDLAVAPPARRKRKA